PRLRDARWLPCPGWGVEMRLGAQKINDPGDCRVEPAIAAEGWTFGDEPALPGRRRAAEVVDEVQETPPGARDSLVNENRADLYRHFSDWDGPPANSRAERENQLMPAALNETRQRVKTWEGPASL